MKLQSVRLFSGIAAQFLPVFSVVALTVGW
jgi:hypothetical protein